MSRRTLIYSYDNLVYGCYDWNYQIFNKSVENFHFSERKHIYLLVRSVELDLGVDIWISFLNLVSLSRSRHFVYGSELFV